MRSKIVIQKPTATSIGLIGLDSLLDVYDNTQAGDLVIVYPGTYDIGNNSIQLKDGVNWKFMPGVTITSSSANGTFYDNNVAVNMKFEGKPKIQNSNGYGYLVVLQNTSSVLDFFYEFSGYLSIPGGGDGSQAEFFIDRNDGDFDWVLTYESSPYHKWKITPSSNFNSVITLLQWMVATKQGATVNDSNSDGALCLFNVGFNKSSPNHFTVFMMDSATWGYLTTGDEESIIPIRARLYFYNFEGSSNKLTIA